MAKKNFENDAKRVVITQSNRLTYARYNYSIIGERVYTFIMYHLQTYIQQQLSGTTVKQMDIFDQKQTTYTIDIPLSRISTPDHYDEIRATCELMATIPIVMMDLEKNERRVAGMICSVQTTFAEHLRYKTVRIEMRTDVIKLLIGLHTNAQGKSNNYTQYYMHVAMTAKNKYTPKIYRLLCRWKDMNGFKIKLEKLRELLGIKESAYKNFNDLKRHVLLPVQKELKEKADLWFNCADADFQEFEGKKVVGVNFRIIVPMSEEILSKKISTIFWMLGNTFGCTSYHCEQIRPILTKDTDWQLVETVMDRCYNKMIDGGIPSPAAYVVKSLLNEFQTG